MNGFMTKAGLGIALAATALTAAVPADAQRWGRGGWGGYRGGGWGGYRGGWGRRGGDAAGAAVLGGIIGLGVGAAIAGSGRDRAYDRGFYDGYRGPPIRNYYREDYRPRCWSEWRFDPYYGDQVPVQVCD